MNEFKINEFLTLKLEEGKTNIYVDGELFNQCKYLMLNIPVDKIEKYDEIGSIDEIADALGWTYNGQEGVEYDIDPETEFWGHCSNLQAWYENDYDTRLLHSNLAFSLLKKLVEVEDPIAKKVFKEEIALRFESGYPTVISCILESHLLNCLNREEQAHLIEKSFPAILKNLERFSHNAKYDVFGKIYRILFKKKKLLEKNFSVFLESMDKLFGQYKYRVFSDLLKVAGETGLIKKHFPAFLESMDKFTGSLKYRAFYVLIDSIKSTELLNEHISQIETQFLVLVESIDKHAMFDKYFCLAFSDLLKVAKILGLIKEYFPVFLETIDKLYEKYYPFYELINSIKNTELMNEYYSRIETQFLVLLNNIDKLRDEDKYSPFSTLINAIRGTELMNEYYSRIETQFLVLLNHIDRLPGYQQYYHFSMLIEVVKETGLLEKQFPVLLGIFAKLPDIDKLANYRKRDAYSNLIKAIKGTDLENETAFKKWKEKNSVF